ncbi:MAG: hypothetical protein WA718_12870 [Terriglobales bacterium]
MKVNRDTERIAALCVRVINVSDAEFEVILEVPNEYRAKTQVLRLIAEHGLH